MNNPPVRGASRFIRGRARGGGAYKPYFYFRRNGRTIPAGGASIGGVALRGAGAGRTNKTSRGRRTRAAGPVAAIRTDSGDLLPSTSFLRPQFYAAPENAVQIVSISVENPVQCPGWRLYFPRDDYIENSEVAKRIKVLEKHYSILPAHYDLLNILTCCCFKILKKVVMTDVGLTEAWPTLLQEMQMYPTRTLATFGAAMHSACTMASIDATLSLPKSNRNQYYPRLIRVRKIYVRPVGFMDIKSVSLFSNEDLDSLHCVRGYVVAMGSVETPCTWLAYKCPRCAQEQAMKQQGIYTVRPHNCKRTECLAKDGFIEQRSSPYTRISPVQIIRLAENNLQAVDLDAIAPEFINIELRQELVDAVYPGQNIIVTGILKMRPLSDEQQNQANDTFSATSHSDEVYMQALAIEDSKYVAQQFTTRDIEAISMINAEPDSFKLLVHSLAPEVHGQEIVKAGVLLSLFGGSGSQLHDESDINVLLVGDPGVGKSSLLQMVSKLSQRGSFMSGKRSSTALQQLAIAVQGRSNFTVQAGALLASSTGHCSIDDIDRVLSQQETLLQVMQTQSLAIPYSSIFANLKLSTAIMATANSARGHYDHSKLITENIRLHSSLLTQFHLLFVLLDKPNKDLDNSLTEHIKALHAGTKKSSAIAARFEVKPKANNSMRLTLSDEQDVDSDNYDLEKRLKLDCFNVGVENELDLVPPILVKKFIAYARQQVRPLLTSEAAEALKNFYMDLRLQCNNDKSCTFSTSQLEGLIRLTQARARIDFSSEATKIHVRDVLCIVRQSMADTTIGNYIECNPATSAVTSGSQNSMAKKFIRMLQLRSNALGRRVFDFDELKDMARVAGISCGVTNLVDIVNLQGFLLKRGPNIYEVMEE